LSTIDLILEILKEKEGWREMKEIASKTNLPLSEIQDIIEFLARHGFVAIDTTGQKVKLGYLMDEFLEEISEIEIEEYA